jgi:hypothetical protein
MLINSPDGLHRSPNTGDGTEFGDTPYQMAQRINALNPKNTSLNTVGAGTVLAAPIVQGLVTRGGAQSGSAFTDTTDTAANIIAGMTPAVAGVNTVVGNAVTFTYLNNTNAIATLTGGTGVTVSGQTTINPNSWVEYLVTYTAAATVTMVAIASGPNAAVPATKFTTAALSAGTLAAGAITGAAFTVLQNTGGTPGAQTTRTAAQMLADIPGAQVGSAFMFRIVNAQGGGTLTLTMDASVTGTGTLTVAANTFRDYVLTFTGAATATIQSVGSGTSP